MATKENYDEFLRVVELSHGRGNNHTVWTLTELGCTAEELLGITNHTKNENYFNTIVTRYSYDDRAIRRIYNKMMDGRNKNQRLLDAFSGWGYRFGDLGWYFKYMPEKYKNEPLPIHKEHIRHLFEKSDDQLNDLELSVYAYRYTTTLLERDNYPSKAFCSDLKQTSLYDELVSPLDWENATVSYDLSNVTFSYIGKQFKNIFYYMGDFYRDYDLARENNTDVQNITKGVQLKLLEQVLQLRVLGNVMMTQIYTEEQIKDGKEMITDSGREVKAINYFDYLINRNRKTGTKRNNYPQTARIELFSQTKSLEMLLAMGLGIKLKRDVGWRVSNKKLNKRIQTAYKTFIKAKTVDDRKSMRKLLLDQANIIINDFMGGSDTFECVMLNCVDKQDEDFEKNMSNAVDIKPIKRKQSKSNSNSNTSSAPVKYVKANVSLSDLLNASTTKVEKARN